MIELRTFDDPRAHSDALANAVSDALKASLAARGAASAGAAGQTAHATLAVSGGTSPKPFLQALSREPLDWAHIDVTLVDDRWVPETDSASNAQFTRDTLLQNAGAAAYFLPLVDTTKPLEAQVTWRTQAGVPLQAATAQQMLQLLLALKRRDDVWSVYSNAEIPDEIVAEL